MKKVISGVFAAVMIGGVAFVGEAVSTATDTNNPYSVQAQTVRVKSKRRVGLTRRVYRGGKYVGTKVWDGTKWVGSKTWKGTKYVGRKTEQGARWTAHKTKRGAKATISRAKKILY